MTRGSADAMSKTLLDYLAVHWLALLLLVGALAPLLGLRRHRTAALVAAGGLALFGVGELLLPLAPAWLTWTVGGRCLTLLLGLVAMLLLTGDWFKPLIPVGAGLLVFALGAL